VTALKIPENRMLTLHTGYSPMDAQDTRMDTWTHGHMDMAPHHPSRELLKGLPGPKSQEALRGVDCSARRARRSKHNPGSRAAHHVQRTGVLFPAGPIYCGTRKHYLIGEVQDADKPSCAPAGRLGTHAGTSGLAHATTRLTAWGKNPAARGGPKPFSIRSTRYLYAL